MVDKRTMIYSMTKNPPYSGEFRLFNQSWPDIKSERQKPAFTNDKSAVNTIGPQQLYVGGMCHTMALYWIARQMTKEQGAGETFIDWVTPNGSQNVNKDAVTVLVNKTVQYKAKGTAASSIGIVSKRKQILMQSSSCATACIRSRARSMRGSTASSTR